MDNTNERYFGLLNTKTTAANDFFDAELTIGIKGQEALNVKQLFAIERLYRNWDNPLIKLAVWIIYKTKL